ncbi:hypothetical protein DFH08DRAFT_809808 [Mycena albidolilacea]|uniref:Uncharacterized protein n=1 Tax=Mycena albidolilacea TaxID=1033008 RepID=A0AAD7ER55_9AGAR|nr:hypothetical protein DFH08DRAFT_809808 [Mycena albidolilacea]
MHLMIGPYLLFLILSQTLDQTPPNTPQRARIAAQRNERDNCVLDSPQHHCVPQNWPYIAPPFQQAQDDVFGGGPVPGLQAFLANLNFQDGYAAPQLTPDSVTLAQEHLAQLQHPLEFNPAPAPAPAPAGRRQPQFNPGNRVNAIAGPLNLRDPPLQIPPVPSPALPNIHPAPQDIPPAAPKARDLKPGFPDLLWCTSGKHYRHQQLFGENDTCSECREKKRRRAQIAAEWCAEEQQQAQQQAQLCQQRPLGVERESVTARIAHDRTSRIQGEDVANWANIHRWGFGFWIGVWGCVPRTREEEPDSGVLQTGFQLDPRLRGA